MLRSIILISLVKLVWAGNNLDYSQYWPESYSENSTRNMGLAPGCDFCGEGFYFEPPPDDILYIPHPPMHPSLHGSIANMINPEMGTEQCNFCNLFYNDGLHLANNDGPDANMSDRIVALLLAFLSISAVLLIYIISTRRTKILASLNRSRLFRSNPNPSAGHPMDKNSSLNESIANSGVHLSDPCYIQSNRDKNLTSPMISDQVPHKKTSIPSKYWAQPGSIIGRTIRRIPNEYEVPSSRTNSTGTSSALYADMHNTDHNQRFFSPYNLHTYAEVREVMDPNENFQTSSNSSAMLSESNYDNGAYMHGNCVVANNGVMSVAPNGSVQMSDFNSMRPAQPLAYGPPMTNSHHPSIKGHPTNVQSMYEQPPQRAQVIITSNNQGVNPSLLNYKDRIHNVI